MKKILFVCVHNAGRSQIAEAFFNRLARSKARATSAGTSPAAQLNPTVVAAMREVGIDLGHRKPKPLTPRMLEEADRVITMGCMEEQACPAALVPTEDWGLEDPQGKPLEEVRKIRDEIKTRVEKLVSGIEKGKARKRVDKD